MNKADRIREKTEELPVAKETYRNEFITGNTFPMNLFRRPALVRPDSLEHYLERLRTGSWVSYWGHANTLAAVNQLCGVDLTPREARPALTTDPEGFPALYGKSYRECCVLTPEYKAGFRPSIGVEIDGGNILSWQVLRIVWGE